MSYQIEEAHSFYKNYILAGFKAKKSFYEARNIRRLEGAIPPQDWEVFGSILVDDLGSDEPYGSDLTRHEVKSVRRGDASPAFEYQYHKEAWRKKLEHDKTIDHVFILYESGYENIEVHLLGPQPFAEHAEGKDWFGRLYDKYEKGKDRGRCSLPFTQVNKYGRMVMKVQGGELAPLPPYEETMF